MDDDDDYPNFGNAFPAASASASPRPVTPSAHWNPAMRPQQGQVPSEPEATPAKTTVADEEDDFFDRYPSATPEQRRGRDALAEANEAEDNKAAAEQRRSPEPRQEDVGMAEPELQVAETVPEDNAAPEEPPASNSERPVEPEAQVDDEVPVFRPGETVSEQREELEHASSLPTDDTLQVTQPDAEVDRAESITVDEPADPEAAITDPSQRYESQGHVPDMEEAIDESVEAPLMEDEEPLPTPGFASRANTLGFGSFAEQGGQAGQTEHPTLDRTFTSNFTEPPQEVQEDPLQETTEQGWPDEGDDQTFGELLDGAKTAPSAEKDSSDPQPAISEAGPVEDVEMADDDVVETTKVAPMEPSPVNSMEAASSAPVDGTTDAKEDDMAAMWQAALDDDEILDDELLDDDDDALDPSAAFGTMDDDGLLEDDPFQSLGQQPTPVPDQQAPAQSAQSRSVSTNQYRPTGAPRPGQSPQVNPYSAPGAQFIDQLHGRSAGTPDTGLFDIYNQPGSMMQQPQQPAKRPAPPQQAQSFADKSKGGYSSPYDLPMDVVKPRRRPQPPPPQQPTSAPAPPPRTSSYTSQSAQPAVAAVPPMRAPSTTSMSPPASSHSGSSGQPQPVAKPSPKTGSGFFEDLPMTVKPRARPSGAYTPQPGGMPTPPPQMPGPPPQQQLPPRGPSVPPMQPPQRPVVPPTSQPQQPAMAGLGLRQPERMPLLPDQADMPPPAVPQGPPASSRYSPSAQTASPPQQQSRFSPALPPAQAPPSNRYSPAPGAQPTGDRPQNRYASAPAQQQPPINRAQSFAPRTSSPLAYHDKPHPPLPAHASHGDLPYSPPQQQNGLHISAPPSEPPTSRYSPAGHHTAGQQTRPRTQSPNAAMKQARSATTTLNRATSSPHQSVQPAQQPHTTRGPLLPHRRQFSRDISFQPPTDERAADPFERWRGHPIFRWAPGGSVVQSFPKQTPYYSSGQVAPTLKCTAGDVKVLQAEAVLAVEESVAKFPGPLAARAKGRKKEVLGWIDGRVEVLERELAGFGQGFGVGGEEERREAEEKLVLWRCIRVFVENEGVLESSPGVVGKGGGKGDVGKIEEEVRKILLPDLEERGRVVDLASPTATTRSGSGQLDATAERDIVMQLRQALLEGQRERAVFLAEEKKLWGHAMLIASTMGPETWKQIIQSFVRSAVKPTGGSDSRSLAALYQIFAGNSEDCVDELVPPSARAGFQMINKVDGSSSSNPLEGLDSWRETLALVLGNRTPNDAHSLLSLGKLLANYSRPSAASVCFLFARSVAKYSGADDSSADFVLLGDLNTPTHPLGSSNLDAILLTEIYEYAASFQAPSAAAAYVPHLQSYKLLHAYELAAYGQTIKAQAYCEHIASAIRSTTRPSGYYHPAFTQAIDDLSRFLSQTPASGAAGAGKSFFSKPSMAKVSSGMGSWFTKLVEGEEDNDRASVASGPGAGEAGQEAQTPFGMVNGDGGAGISRSASGNELYNGAANAMAGPYTPMAPPAQAHGQGRYAPSAALQPQQSQGSGGRYAPSAASTYTPAGRSSNDSDRSSIPSSLGISAAEPQRPSSARYASYAPQQPQQGGMGASLGVPRPEVTRATSDFHAPYNGSASRRGSQQSVQSNLSRGSYEPRPALAEQQQQPQGMGMYGGYQPSPPQTSPGFGQGEYPGSAHDSNGMPSPAVQPEQQQEPQPDPEDGGYAPPASSGGYEPPSTSYEPSTSSYEPPSTGYVPYEPEPDSPVESTKPRRGMMDDDDDDLVSRAAALKIQDPASSSPPSDRAAADAAADAAFRAAAEADAARDKAKAAPKKSGWFGGGGGGWFGKKSGDDLSSPAAAGNGPIRAKLGEESSFYYDKELGKWVNKKGGLEEQKAASATPPPPKGMGSRAASGVGMMGPPSGPPSRVASGASLPPAGAGSRPSTSSGLAGPGVGSQPPSRSGTPAGEGVASGVPPGLAPPSRPATGLSNASSLDDLMAPGPGGKKGTVKGKKRGGRYVDVMAK